MVGRPIAFNGQNISARLVGMTNTKVNSETCRADLVIGQEAKTPDDIGDIFLKGRIRVFSGRGAIIQAAILGEI
jgi:hypothetical protein